ncbi:DNRLRE domain-containing protein [Kineococcus gynurae]|uniref:DNRLRE domain-containing protein n=1 Tax=Kineococcus gynurae TaxID=452979 RepID=UPI003D7C6F11
MDSLTTATSITLAQPDGELQTTTAGSAVRYRIDGKTGADPSGEATWADIDLSLTGEAGGRTTAEAAGPWSARLAGESGAAMVAVGPAGQTITWSPQAAAAPVGRGGPGGPLPAVRPTAPSAGVTPVQVGVDLEVAPADAAPAPGEGPEAPGPIAGAAPAAAQLQSLRAGPTLAAATAATSEGDGGVGSEAAFPGVLKGERDYSVAVTATGAEESVVIDSRERVSAAGGAAAAAVYRNSFSLPAGITVRQAAARDGVAAEVLGVEFVDSTGTVIATYGGGKAYDSSSNEVGEPATAPVATRLLAVAPATGAGRGTATVEVSVDPTWVGDNARVFPVTIDPHIATGSGFSGTTASGSTGSADAYVDEAFPTTAEGVQDANRLLMGVRPINGANKNSATLLYFNLGDLVGSENTITAASLSLWNNYSYSCTAYGVRVDAALTPWNASTVTWNTGPQGAGTPVIRSFARGYSSSCAAGSESFDVRNIVQQWSNGTAGYYSGRANNGFVLTADGTGHHRLQAVQLR